jgi:hypothetical protein
MVCLLVVIKRIHLKAVESPRSSPDLTALIHSSVLVILSNNRSPFLQKGGYPRGGVRVSENWGFVMI